jgi:hypothetical protein
MTNPKPNRTAIEGALTVMRHGYRKMPPATDPIDAHSRALTVPLTEAVCRQLGDALDAGEDHEAFAQGFTHALANVIVTLASNISGHQQPALAITTEMLCQAIAYRATKAAADGGPEGVSYVVAGAR